MITAEQIPNVVFENYEALRTFAAEALAIESVRADFQVTGDAATFWEQMSAFGFDADEIEAAIVAPAARPAALYI